MRYQQALDYMVEGDCVQRETWPETRVLCRNPDMSLELCDDGEMASHRYEPTAEDRAATDWIAYAG